MTFYPTILGTTVRRSMNGQTFAVLFMLGLSPILFSVTSASPFAETGNHAIVQKPTVAADNAASLGKTIVARLVDTDREEASDLGFYSSDEATEANMTVGTGMAIMTLNLKKLKPGDTPSPLTEILKPTDEFLYPILYKGKVRSAVTVRRIGPKGDWRPVAYGARGALLAAEELKLLESAFIIRLYARNLWFLATGEGDDLVFYRLTPNANAVSRIAIGKPQNYKTVFAEFIKESKRLRQDESQSGRAHQ